MRPVRIGVLALQGAFREHVQALHRLGAEAVEVRTADDLQGLDGLIVPGGESTTIDKLLDWSGLREALVARLDDGLPAFGTCAGMIVLGESLTVFNVGDSRVYRWQDGFLCQLSTDHAVPGQRGLTQALGGREAPVTVTPNVVAERWIEGRRYLICSDGLFEAVPLDEMEAVLAEPPAIAAEHLLRIALAGRARDNFSALILVRA